MKVEKDIVWVETTAVDMKNRASISVGKQPSKHCRSEAAS
jgi:hypothetical protein